MSRQRTVFDTSTLISAVLKADSIPFRALFLALDIHDVCVSEATLIELADVLMRSKFDHRIARQARLNFLSVIGTRTRSISVEEKKEALLSPFCRDAKYNKFLLLAETAKAEVIISSDQDLLVLHPWNGISILTPADFLSKFQDR